MIRILLVDDQNLVQEGIKSLLDRDEEFEVIGTVKDGKSAIKQINLLRPDIVLLDIEMPGMNGISVTKYINHFLPETKVIILSSHEDKRYLVQSLVAGAKAYILKSSLMTDLKQAILAVDHGYSQIESRLLAKVLTPKNVKTPTTKSYASDIHNIKHQNSDREQLLNNKKAANQVEPENNNLLAKKRVKKVASTTTVVANLANAKESETETSPGQNVVSPEKSSQTIDLQKREQETNPTVVGTNEEEISITAVVADLANAEESETETSPGQSVVSPAKSSQTIDLQKREQETNPTVVGTNEEEISITAVVADLANAEESETEKAEKIAKSEQKTKIQANSPNELLESEQKTEIPQTKTERLLESDQKTETSQLSSNSGDEPSYPQQLHDYTTYDLYHSAEETALVPLGISSLSEQKIEFGSNLKRPKSKILIIKNHLQKWGNNPTISKFSKPVFKFFRQATFKCKTQILQYAQPAISRYFPRWEQYKSKFILFVGRKNTQKWLGNIGLMLLGGIIVLILHV